MSDMDTQEPRYTREQIVEAITSLPGVTEYADKYTLAEDVILALIKKVVRYRSQPVRDMNLFEAKIRITELEGQLAACRASSKQVSLEEDARLAAVTAERDDAQQRLSLCEEKIKRLREETNAEIAKITAERDGLREQVERLSSPLSDEEWEKVRNEETIIDCDLPDEFAYRDEIDKLIADRAAMIGEPSGERIGYRRAWLRTTPTVQSGFCIEEDE